MEKSKRFTKIGIVEGFKISENPRTLDQVWIIGSSLYKIDKRGNVTPIKIK